jgi:hypothetical protein
MISFSSLRKVGGFGNQLFQVAASLALSHSKNANNAFPDWVGNYIFKQPFNRLSKIEELYLFNSHRLFSKPYIKKIYYPNWLFRQKGSSYSTLETLPKNVDLLGYFQSSKHFKCFKKEIRDSFTLNEECQDFIDKVYTNLVSDSKSVVSVHVRRGDYLKKKNLYPFCGKKYYKNSMKLFDENTLFLIFSDDMEWCKNNIRGHNIRYVETRSLKTPIDKFFKEGVKNNCNEENQWVDLLLMSKTNHNIISNSSFSWWGSWLNINPDKQVIAPNKWFGDSFKKYNVFQDDIYEDNWNIIPTE